MKIPVIEASGSNYDIGFVIGKTLRNKIKDLIKVQNSEYQEELNKGMSHYAKCADLLINYTSKYFPKYIDEMKGMADGCGEDLRTIFMLGCEDELLYGCTSVAGFSDEGIILGHNEDWLKHYAKYLYICKMDDSMSLTYTGHLPGFCFGYKYNKFAFTGNSIHFKSAKIGIPWHFFNRAFLDAKNFKDLLKIASMKNKLIGFNSLFITKNKIFDLEMGPTGYAILKNNNYLAHTNHLLHKSIKSQEVSHSKDSIWRLNRENELLKNNAFSFELAKKILSDHKHRPYSICCHEFEKKGITPYSTLASVIVNITKNEFHLAYGNPCKARYMKYKL